jgi:hypothetical protein
MKLMYRAKARFYDVFALFVMLLIKAIYEFTGVYAILGGAEYVTPYNSVLFMLILFAAIVLCGSVLRRAYEAMEILWSKGEAFYLRYVLCIASISSIMVLIRHISNYESR